MRRAVVVGLVVLGSSVPGAMAQAAPGDLHLASANTAGLASDGDQFPPTASADGTKVAFPSSATNLHPADTDTHMDVYVKDLETGAVILASRTAAGVKGNADSSIAAISADGTRVAFASDATNLHPSGAPGVYVKDLVTGALTLASTTASGLPASDRATDVTLSDDGGVVAFSTPATNLDPRDTVSDGDVYVKDLASGKLTLASVSAAGEKRPGLFGARRPDLSKDGSRVAFHSDAADLLPADPDGEFDVFVRDLRTGALVLASIDGGVKGNRGSLAPSLSADGTLVAMSTFATNFEGGPKLSGGSGIYLKDLVGGSLKLASLNAAGSAILGGVSDPSLSADGSRVAFSSPSTNAHPNDTDSLHDVFVKDFATGHVFLGSSSSDGTKGNGSSFGISLANGGGTVAFTSTASNLDPADNDAVPDIYAKELGDKQPPPPGDGADLAARLTDFFDPAPVRTENEYTAVATNTGPATARTATITVALPDGVRFVSASAQGGACPQVGMVVRCSFSNLASGQAAVVRIRVMTRRAGTFTATATVASPDTADPDPGDNSDEETTVVVR